MILKRNPVPKNGFEIFRHEIWLLAELTGASNDSTVRQALKVLDDVLIQKMSNQIVKRAIKNPGPMKFYKIFKQKYLEAFDIEYIAEWNGKDINIALSILSKIEAAGATVEEYVLWLFDDFFPNNAGKMTANHKLALSTNVVQSFLTSSAERLKGKTENKMERMREEIITNDARALYRETKDQRVYDAIQAFKEKKLTLDGLEAEIEKIKISVKK